MVLCFVRDFLNDLIQFSAAQLILRHTHSIERVPVKSVQFIFGTSVAKRGEFSRFVGFLAQKGGQIFEDGDLWD